MRVLPLYGLVGVAGLVVASPTPATPTKRLTVYSQDQFQGSSYDIDATHRCVKLESPVYKNLHSYGVVDQVCYFMDTDRCNGKTLITVDAQGTEVWGRVDVDNVNGYAGRITSVYCADQSPTIAVDTSAVPAKRDENTILNKGDVRACKGDKCSWVKALGSCKAFSDDVAKQIDSLMQTAGSTCEYWGNKDCSRLILTSISGSKDYHPNLGPSNSDGLEISAVSCKASRFAETVGKGRTFVASHHGLSVPEESRGLTKFEGRSATATPCDDPHFLNPDRQTGPGSLYFCATANHDPTLKNPKDCLSYRSCMKAEALDKCVAIKQERNLFPMFDTLWQAQGAVCNYYKSSCKDQWPILIIDSRAHYLPPIDYKKLLPFVSTITEVRCYINPTTADLGAGPDTVVLDSTNPLLIPDADDTFNTARAEQQDKPISTISTTNPEVAVAAVDYPVNMKVCHEVNLGGRCLAYTGPGCAPNPFNVDAIESIWLPQGWRCALYPYWNCSAERGPPHYLEARDGDVTVDDVTYEIWSVTCVPLPF